MTDVDKLVHIIIAHTGIDRDEALYLLDDLRYEFNFGGWTSVKDELPPMDEIVYLWDGEKIWSGGRGMVDSQHWLYGNSYGHHWYDYKQQKWFGDIETDDDYQPIMWKHKPLPPQQ